MRLLKTYKFDQSRFEIRELADEKNPEYSHSLAYAGRRGTNPSASRTSPWREDERMPEFGALLFQSKGRWIQLRLDGYVLYRQD